MRKAGSHFRREQVSVSARRTTQKEETTRACPVEKQGDSKARVAVNHARMMCVAVLLNELSPCLDIRKKVWTREVEEEKKRRTHRGLKR